MNKDLVATIGTYTDKTTGEKKYITRKVGTYLETQHGPAIKIDACFVPSGCKIEEDGSVWLKLFDQKPKTPAQLQQEGLNSQRSPNESLGQAQHRASQAMQAPAGFDQFDDTDPPF